MSDINYNDDVLNLVNRQHASFKEVRNIAGNTAGTYRNGNAQRHSSRVTHSSNEKRKYTGNLRAKQPRPKRALIFALAAAIAVGSLVVSKVHSELEKPNLEESQEILADISNNQFVLNELGLSQENSNAVQLLNADLESLSERYAENPSSVSDKEVKDLLQSCYSLGREIVFDKVDSGLRDYYEEHPDKSSVQSADEAGSRYIYRVGDPKNNESPYFIAVRGMTPSGIETDTCVADGQEISDYVGSQLEVSNYIDSDNFNVRKGLELAQNAIEDVSRMSIAEVAFHDDILGAKKTDVIYYERDNASDEKNTAENNISQASSSPSLDDDEPEL